MAQQGYVYWDGTAGSNNFGLLSHDGTWSVQCTSTATYLHNASYVDGNLILHAGNYGSYANLITNNNQLTNGAGYTTYSANQAVDTTSTPSFADVYTTGWFRNSQDNEGLFNSINGNHFYSSTNYWDMDSPAGLRLRDAFEGGIKGYVYWSGSNFGLLSQNGSWRVQIEAETSVNIKSVDLICDADVIAFSSSDRRLKNELKPIEDPIDKIRKLTGYTFTWNELQSSYIGEDIGVVAQEVNEVVPEVVTERDDGYLAVKYEKMIPLLIEAMKEQQDQIDELTKQIKELKNDNTNQWGNKIQ